MAGSIKGIIVEIGGDTSGLQKALKNVNSATSSLTKELKGINSLLKFDPKNTELLAQKQTVLSQNIQETTNKLEQLKQAQKLADETIKNGGEISQENYRYLQREIINTENKLKDLKVEASDWTTVSKSLDSISKKMKTVGDSISSIGGTLTTGVTVPVVGIVGAATAVGNEFEAQMSRVQAIAGATGEELNLLTEQALQLGAQTSFSATEAAEGMENLASAGFTTEEIMEAIPGLLDLAASSGSELATASEIAASAIRGFGLDASEAGHVADVFAEAAARTNAQTEDMGNAMKYIAPVAHTMGISLEETAAAIGIMSDAGIKGEQAGTTLRGALTRLTKPTNKMIGTMEELGISFYDNEGKMKSLTEIVKMLQDSMQGLSDEEQQYALTTLFGTESLSGMLALISRGPEELSTMTNSFKDCDGAASEMADTMLNNTFGAIEEMNGAIESLGIKIQQILAPYIVEAANKVQELVNKFLNLPESTQKTILAIAGIVAAIGPALLIIGKLISAGSAIVGVLGQVSGAIAGVSAGTGVLSKVLTAITGPVGIVITIITTLIGVFTYLYNTNEQFRLKVQETWNNLVALFQETVMPVIENLKNLLTSVFSTVTSVLQQIWSYIEPFITEMLTWLMDFWNNTGSKILENVMGVVNGLIDIVTMIWNNVISPIVNFLVEHLQPVFSAVFSVISGIVQIFGNTIGTVIEAVTGIFKGIIDFITGVFSGNWEKAWQGISDVFKNIVDGLWGIIKTPLNWIIDGINGLIGGINSIKIPDWVPLVGGASFNIPKIPKLAKGGIVDEATLAMVGEGKSAEAIIPLDRTLTRYMSEALKEAGASNNITLNFYPQSMTEADLNMAFNYINRRFGLNY